MERQERPLPEEFIEPQIALQYQYYWTAFCENSPERPQGAAGPGRIPQSKLYDWEARWFGLPVDMVDFGYLWAVVSGVDVRYLELISEKEDDDPNEPEDEDLEDDADFYDDDDDDDDEDLDDYADWFSET